MIPSYLVTQDGLLNQPSVTVQADPGIAPASHFGDAPGGGGGGGAAPDLQRGGGTPGLRLSNGPGSQTLTVSVSSWEGARQS